MLNTLLHAALAFSLLIIAHPLATRSSQQKLVTTMKHLTMTGLLLLIVHTNCGLSTTTTTMTWLALGQNIKISFTLDHHTILFFSVATIITWTIMEFTSWYMSSDPNITKFSKYLLLFLAAMLTLTTTDNMLQLFIGWEGVGIMSFLLIGWWGARVNANTSALQAVIYNRTGDIGLILTLAWAAMNLNTWEMQLLFSHTTPTLPLLGLVLAAMGKSAQFGLHPWLPAAMEGPTPVSALLHSSTMVVAGIFLLIRLSPLTQNNPLVLTTCLCLGGITTLFAALCACTQNDIKKIIAFSTSSQLGLMMLTLGLNQPSLALLHITTHAFFKAMLFLCSGSIIHALNNEQDIRKMGGLQTTMPITTRCLTLGSLALAGTPYLAGFFTKDTIIETMNTSYTNAWALTITMAATALTAAYSLRLIFYVQLTVPRFPPLLHITEADPRQTSPLLRLALGSIVSGLIMVTLSLSTNLQIMTMPPTMKLGALLASAVGLYLASDLMLSKTLPTKTTKSPLLVTLTQLAFFNTLIHRSPTTASIKKGQVPALQLTDTLWYECLGPSGLKTLNTSLTAKLSQPHTGQIKTYLTIFTMTMVLTLLLHPA